MGASIQPHSDFRVFLLEGTAVTWSFTFAGLGPGQSSLIEQPVGFLRVAIPSLAALAGLWMRNVWGSAEDSAQAAPVVDVVVAYALAFATQLPLARFLPALALPHWYATEGGMVGPWFVVLVRALCPPGTRTGIAGPVRAGAASAEEISCRTGELRRQARFVERSAMLAAFSMALIAVWVGFNGTLRMRVAGGLILGGSACTAIALRRQRGREQVAARMSLEARREAYRRDLDRQCALLEWIRIWCYASVVPGIVLIIAGTRTYHFVAVLVGLLAAELTGRAKEDLDRELDAIRATPATV